MSAFLLVSDFAGHNILAQGLSQGHLQGDGSWRGGKAQIGTVQILLTGIEALSSWNNKSGGTWQGRPSYRPGMLKQQQEVKTPPSKSQTIPQKCCRKAQTESWDTKAFVKQVY
jgi:hypothetical protein